MEDPLFSGRLARYREEVARANTEPTRAFLFLELLRETFSGVVASYGEVLLPELEHVVRVKKGTVAINGRIDAILSNQIIEFKLGMGGREREEAEGQLKKYLAALYMQGKREYLAVASDGIRFVVYVPRFPAAGTSVAPEEVRLEPADELDLTRDNDRDVYLWLDRYLLARELQTPSTTTFVQEFGTGAFPMLVQERLRNLWERERAGYHGLYREWADYLSVVYGSRVESEQLFLRQTYLATLARLMAYMLFSEGQAPSTRLLGEILQGQLFAEWGILNFLEEDFFSWLGRHADGLRLAGEMVRRLARYNIARLEEDVLKGLYQHLVDPETRHDLGEYYTPEWVAEWMVERVLGDGPCRSVLDPACGSGTFLAAAIRHKIAYSGLGPEELLAHLQDSVVGIDIHPLAVAIAKINYLLALRPLLRHRAGPVTLPVYLADSLRPYGHQETRHGVATYGRVLSGGTVLRVPELADRAALDEAAGAIRSYALARVQAGPAQPLVFAAFLPRESCLRQSLDSGLLAPESLSVLGETGEALARLIRDPQGGDTIWAFVLRNFYQPVFLLGKFDVVVGNPPWLSYRYVENLDYQAFLKEKITQHYRLTTRAELMTHMEVATLFFLAAADLYLRDGGEIGFVMPRAVFTGDQHDCLRQGTYRNIALGLHYIVDLDKVDPLFKDPGQGTVPACLLFATKGARTPEQVPGLTMEAHLHSRNPPLALVRENLRTKEAQFSVVTVGKRSFLAAGVPTIHLAPGRSYYYDKFADGATLYPRPFWFVDIPVHPQFGLDRTRPYLRTSARAQEPGRAKKEYQGVTLEGAVEAQFLFATLTGSEVLPFTHLPFPPMVLPVRVEGGRFVMCTREWARQYGYRGLAAWLEQAERVWNERRWEKASRTSLYEWLDYRHKLTQQNPGAPCKVVYIASGTHLVASVVEPATELHVEINGVQLPLRAFVTDYRLFHLDATSEAEASYLTAVLNSGLVDRIIKPMQTKGLFGPRDICKKVLELPFPKYDPSLPAHGELVRLAQECRERAQLEPVRARTPGELGRERTRLRHILSPQLQEIDRLVAQVLEGRG